MTHDPGRRFSAMSPAAEPKHPEGAWTQPGWARYFLVVRWRSCGPGLEWCFMNGSTVAETAAPLASRLAHFWLAALFFFLGATGLTAARGQPATAPMTRPNT